MLPVFVLVSGLITLTSSSKPLVISSKRFLDHHSKGYHPESPDRISSCLEQISRLTSVDIKAPSAETHAHSHNFALELIRRAHDPKYVQRVEILCRKNVTMVDPWDEDTYLSPETFKQTILAQSAWIDGVNAVVNDRRTSFALTRPPGHHACTARSMGFCIFNFAVGAALYALDHLKLERIAILDFDVRI